MNKQEDDINGIESITYAIINGAILTKKVQLSWFIDASDDGVNEIDVITYTAINGVMTDRKVQVFMSCAGEEWIELPQDLAEEMCPPEEEKT
ncbi:hypothetical protein KAW65_04050 [candidate division WOR-3 bacterium]|nr:hypothetical protein [candidate division WOR-3 bacterium]